MWLRAWSKLVWEEGRVRARGRCSGCEVTDSGSTPLLRMSAGRKLATWLSLKWRAESLKTRTAVLHLHLHPHLACDVLLPLAARCCTLTAASSRNVKAREGPRPAPMPSHLVTR